MFKGSALLILILILGFTTIFAAVAFAVENPLERPVTYVVCKVRPGDIVCKNP